MKGILYQHFTFTRLGTFLELNLLPERTSYLRIKYNVFSRFKYLRTGYMSRVELLCR